MPAEYYYPVSTAGVFGSFYDQWAQYGGANKNSNVRPGGGRSGPMTHDDDTSAVWTNGLVNQNVQQSFTLDWPDPMAAFSEVTIGMRTRHYTASGNSARSVRLINAAGATSGNGGYIQDSVTTYANQGPGSVYASPPSGGWPTVLTQANMGAYLLDYSNGGSAFCTSIWGLVTYTVPAGGFVFLLGLAGLAALPLVGTLCDRPHFDAYLAWRQAHHPRHTLVLTGEADEAWRELRAYRHPRFFLPGRGRGLRLANRAGADRGSILIVEGEVPQSSVG